MGFLQTIGILVLGGGTGVLMSLVGLGYLSSYVEMRRTDTVDVRQLNDPAGTVELTGTARVHEATGRSPLTGTESLVYSWRVQEYDPRPANKRTSKWRTLDTGTETHPFLLDDGTGTALVDPGGASNQLETTTTIEVDGDESAPPAIEEFLAGADHVDADHDHQRRYKEARLDPGDVVHVLGPVRETGHAADLPADVDAVVGVENPGERGFTVGEDGTSDLVEQSKADTDRFVLSNGDEGGAERSALKSSILWLGVGLFFLAASVAAVLVG